MSTYTLYAQYVEGELVNVEISANNPIVVYTLQAPGVGLMRLRDLVDVDDDTPANGEALIYSTSTGTWGPQPLAGGGDMLKATYDSDNNGIINANAGGLGADASAFSGIIKMSGGAASVASAGTDYAAASHTHSAAEINSGTFDDARIAASNVTQHEGSITHNNLSGLTTGDPHTQYSLADGTRWTGTPTANRIVRSDGSGNLIASDMVHDGTNIRLAAGQNLNIPAIPGYLYIGSSLAACGILSYQTGSPNQFFVNANLGRLYLSGATSLVLRAAGGTEFTWPSADGSSGHVMKTDGAGALALADPNTLISSASTTVAGKVELATTAETDTGTDTGRAVTPDGLAGSYAGTKSVSAYVVAAGTDVSTGDGKAYITIPPACAGMNLVGVHARVITAGTTGTTDIQIHNVTQGADMLTTKITIDSAETGSDTAATPPVIDTANDDVAAYDLLRVDVDAVSTTAPQGLIVTLEFRLP